MNALDHTLLGLAKRHPEESPEFAEWIKHSSFVAFLKALPNLEEVCLYASYDHFFLYGIAVPAEIVTPPDAQDLDRWSCNPYSEWGMCTTSGADGKVFLSPPLNTESKTLDRGEQLVFARTFEGGAATRRTSRYPPAWSNRSDSTLFSSAMRTAAWMRTEMSRR